RVPADPRPHTLSLPDALPIFLMRWRATLAWAAYLIPAAALALYAVAQWLLALVNRTPVLYGEGAVANAARLARDGIAYLDPDPRSEEHTSELQSPCNLVCRLP